MKSILTYFLSILLIIFSTSSYSQIKSESNSPGGNQQINNKSSSPQILEEKCLALENAINIKNERIQKLYFFQQKVLDSYGGGSQTITKSIKRNIFKAGQTLIDAQRENINNLPLNNVSNKLESLREIEKIQDRLIFYSGIEKSRPIEKRLKKLKTPQTIEPVFFEEQ